MLRLLDSKNFNYSSENWEINCSEIQLPNSTPTRQGGYGGFGLKLKIKSKHVGGFIVQLHSSNHSFTAKPDSNGICLLVPEKNRLDQYEIRIKKSCLA